MISSYVEVLQDQFPYPIIVSLVAVSTVIVYLLLKNRNLPPGPTGLPYLGYLPFLQNEATYKQLTELGKKYGDVFSFRSCGHLFIHLGSIKVIREAHLTKSDYFGTRLTVFSMFTQLFDGGLILVDGEGWKILRKFFVQQFKQHGLTAFRDDLATSVYDNVSALVEELRMCKEKPVNIIDALNEKCFLIVRRIMFNDDGITMEQLKEINKEFEVVLQGITGLNFLILGNFAKYIVCPFSAVFKASSTGQKRIIEILEEVVKKRDSTFQDGHIRDLIDGFLKERNDRRLRGDPTVKYFTYNSLTNTLSQFVTDGALSVAVYIGAIIQCLVKYPEEQEKIYSELMEVVGADRQPSLEDRNKLPYTMAFLQEVERTTDFFPLFPARTCTQETALNGYRIPKGAITLVNVWSAHYHPETYKNPTKFDPSRFLPNSGKGKEEHPVAFGIGKRSCIGEAFVNMQGFLFTTALVKNFRLTLPEGAVNKSSLFEVTEKLHICAHPRVPAKT